MEPIAYEESKFGEAAIHQRKTDGYLNATDMCKANNKKYNDWYRLDSTKEYLNELSSDTGYPVSQLVEVRKGNSKKYKQGTWIHPYVATNLAQWLSPKFAVFVSKLVFRYLNGDLSLIDEIKQNNEVLQNQVKQLQSENKEKEDTLNRLHNIQKELLSYKKRVTKEEIIYIVSTSNYARQGIFKIGRTKNKMNFRSSAHNNTHIEGDKVKVIKAFSVNDSVLVERNIHAKLNGLLLEGEKEFFMCPYDLLESIVDVIINNDDEENNMVNKIVDTVYKLKRIAFKSEDWAQGIPEDIFKETLTIAAGDEKLAELDISEWGEQRKQEFVGFCIKEYIKENNSLNEESFQIMWKTFQTFLVAQLPIVKSKFKATEWKAFVKEEAKKEKLQIKWRS
jgi:hypothetical protein